MGGVLLCAEEFVVLFDGIVIEVAQFESKVFMGGRRVEVFKVDVVGDYDYFIHHCEVSIIILTNHLSQRILKKLLE